MNLENHQILCELTRRLIINFVITEILLIISNTLRIETIQP